MRNNYKNLCRSRLDEYAGQTGRPIARYARGEWPHPEGALTLYEESGVKRLREYVGQTGGMHNIGPGCSTWRELYLFLDGMCEAERLREGAVALA